MPLVDPRLRAHTFCHVVPDTWYLMGVVLTAMAVDMILAGLNRYFLVCELKTAGLATGRSCLATAC